MEIKVVNLVLLGLLVCVQAVPWTHKERSLRTQLAQKDPRIVGGASAPLHVFPYQVALSYFDDQHYFGGCLITDQWVLTTAVAATWGSKKPLVILGAQSLEDTEFSQQKIQSDEIIVHELWVNSMFDNAIFEKNIALIHLERAAELNRYVSPITLAAFNAPNFEGSSLVMSGYGFVTDVTPGKSLRYVMADGISNSDCKKIHKDKIKDGLLCVETIKGEGSCAYDIGDPLVDVESGLLVGLMGDNFCGKGAPDIFTRVSSFNKWIANKIN